MTHRHTAPRTCCDRRRDTVLSTLLCRWQQQFVRRGDRRADITDGMKQLTTTGKQSSTATIVTASTKPNQINHTHAPLRHRSHRRMATITDKHTHTHQTIKRSSDPPPRRAKRTATSASIRHVCRDKLDTSRNPPKRNTRGTPHPYMQPSPTTASFFMWLYAQHRRSRLHFQHRHR
jgi:hypothetical protein